MSERYEWLDERVDELIERYESGQSLQDIADIFDVSPPTIQRRLHEHDVEMRNGGRSYGKLEMYADEIISQYAKAGDDLQTIADRYETSVTAIEYYLDDASQWNHQVHNVPTSDSRRHRCLSFVGNSSATAVSTERSLGSVFSSFQQRHGLTPSG